MRPSLRLLNLEVPSLQGSRALYVCSGCRQEARPRPIAARQFLRHASNADSLSERVRRKIWGTDNPPGEKDPYGGQGVLERKFSKQQPPKQEEVAEQPEEVEDLTLTDASYEPATTWAGLERVGHLNRWNDYPRSEADTYESFAVKTKHNQKGPLSLAAHQAAVEICLMHALNKPLVSVCDVTEHEKPIFDMIYECKIQPNGEWSKALEYPNKRTQDTLAYIFEQIGAQPAAPAAEETAEDLVEASELEENGEIADEPASDSQDAPFFGYQDVQDEGFLSLPLTDAVTKFAYLKRFSQLSGHYFPDPIMQQISTVKQAVAYAQGELNKKPKKLAEYLAEDQRLLSLPNVKIFDKRRTTLHRDDEMGRKKIIEAALRARGLL
ncbi:hypothetical protein BO70DRAFT_365844 [Aspergillus heteromorphus CBS 117.55]|uniref:Large ribosomal subunit protein mL50 n=1 Tax=Aspergillus heteromorphus CBS 117.55 TaxID=1448321 RepID=A0A317V8E0_9EURO|nr:uncharacterized protein BO70DRAFT_365844 [Aspergillus heteromorphus CBS 117.55]PWY69571.1 hypothetical protein BO70DRAFT_365844 [Aspergillus heteromorphus CBS 117.55]